MTTGQISKHIIEHSLPQKESPIFVYTFIPLGDKTKNSCGLFIERVLYPITHVFIHEWLSSTLPKMEHRMGRDLDCREDVEHHLVVTHVPHGISCAIPVYVNMTRCVYCKQQTYGNEFPVLLLLQQSKSYYISLFLFTCLHY